MTNFRTTSSLYSGAGSATAIAADAGAGGRSVMLRRPSCVSAVVVAADLAEDEQHREQEQRDAEDVHLVVHRTGAQQQADDRKHRHQQPDDDVGCLDVHLSALSLWVSITRA